MGLAGGGTLRDGRPGPARSRCLRLQPLPALSRRRLGAPGGRKRLRAAGHVPCCWPRVRPAEGARGAGRVIGRAQPTGRGTGSPQPRGDPGKTGGSWGWVVRGPLGALLRGRWPRAPSAFPAPWQGPGSRGGGPGWAGQGGLSLSQGRGDPVSGNAGPLPPPDSRARRPGLSSREVRALRVCGTHACTHAPRRPPGSATVRGGAVPRRTSSRYGANSPVPSTPALSVTGPAGPTDSCLVLPGLTSDHPLLPSLPPHHKLVLLGASKPRPGARLGSPSAPHL